MTGGELWVGHPATPHQQELPFQGTRKRRKQLTQADVLIGLLRAARANGSPLDLPSIMRAGIAQHGARFTELRSQGFEIVNEMVRGDGVVRSSYRLIFDPARDVR